MADDSRKPSISEWAAAQVRVTIFTADNDWPKGLAPWDGLGLDEPAS